MEPPVATAGSPVLPDEPWAADVDAVVASLDTDAVAGLTADEVAERLDRWGPNRLAEGHRVTRLELFARQFANTMILVLAAAGVVTFSIGEHLDTAVIGIIVVLNAVIGFLQEYRAEQAMEALSGLTTTVAVVRRDGAWTEVPADALVPGDVVALGAGDVVPADLRLIVAEALETNEAPLTGESTTVGKTTDALDPTDAEALGDRRNMAYKGTAVTRGRGRGVVVATGMATEIGHIAELLGSGERTQTPLQRRLGSLGRWLAGAALVICAVVFGVGVLTGEPAREMFLRAVSLAVAAIPEGLPAVVTVALALGARRMADRQALVRRLPAVETLGSVTVICSDKTGTLTENRMAVEHVWTPAGSATIAGRGYEPRATVRAEPGTEDALRRLAEVAAACNDAELVEPDDGGDWGLRGDPTEGALVALASRLDVDGPDHRRGEVPFDERRRRMTTLHDHADGGYWVATKGALDAVLPLLAPDQHDVALAAEAAAAELSDDGYRVLALAEGRVEEGRVDEGRVDGGGVEGGSAAEHIESDLRLVGLVGIADPPRPEVAAAVRTCRAAGMIPVMITGDHPGTARAIALRLGLLDAADADSAVLTGADLDELDDDALTDRVADVRVYARVTPEEKLRIIDAWQRHGDVVAMTGDGVNDAPALHRADIGLAMGITGTDVSREAADMVLADDNFATIVRAVEEGRRIYDNIRRFVRYLLTTNSGELWVMLLAPLVGLPFPLTAVQILWINLVTDGLPAVALGLEPAEEHAMRRPPRPPKESILAGGLWQDALVVGLLMAAVVLPLQGLTRAADWPWQTMVFTTLALLQLGNALAVRSERRSAFGMGIRTNVWLFVALLSSAAAQLATVYVPVLHDVFDTEPLDAWQLGVVLVASTAAFVAVEAEKWWRRRQAAAQTGDQVG